MNSDNNQEMFPLVNEQGNIIGAATRGECHNGSKLLHPVIHLHVFNSKGELYLFENGKLTLYLKNKERIERISNILGDSLGNLWITSCNSF